MFAEIKAGFRNIPQGLLNPKVSRETTTKCVLSIFFSAKREASSRCHHSNTLFGWQVKTFFFLHPQWVWHVLIRHTAECSSFKTGRRLQISNTLLFSFYHFLAAAWNWSVNCNACCPPSASVTTSAAPNRHRNGVCSVAHGTQCSRDLRRFGFDAHLTSLLSRLSPWHDTGVASVTTAGESKRDEHDVRAARACIYRASRGNKRIIVHTRARARAKFQWSQRQHHWMAALSACRHTKDTSFHFISPNPRNKINK